MNFAGLFEQMIQPDKLHILSLSVLIKNLQRTRGGVAGNIVYNLALLGDRPVLLAAIGAEQSAYIEALSALGVDVSAVHFSKLPTATFSVITDRNDCQVGGFYPGAMGDCRGLTFDKFSDPSTLFVVSPHDPAQMARQVAECFRGKKRLFFDVGQQVVALPEKVLRQGIKAAELLIANDYEMGVLSQRSGWSVEEIIRLVKVLVITKGENGSQVYSAGKVTAVAAAKPAKLVDPTGAGDAYRAGFLHGYLRDWPPETCAKLGSVVAVYAVEKHGTQEHSFTFEQVRQRFKKTFKQELAL